MALITLLAPLVVELLKIFFGGSSTEKEKAAVEIKEALRRIRAAISHAEETDGDTSKIEDIINKP